MTGQWTCQWTMWRNQRLPLDRIQNETVEHLFSRIRRYGSSHGAEWLCGYQQIKIEFDAEFNSENLNIESSSIGLLWTFCCTILEDSIAEPWRDYWIVMELVCATRVSELSERKIWNWTLNTQEFIVDTKLISTISFNKIIHSLIDSSHHNQPRCQERFPLRSEKSHRLIRGDIDMWRSTVISSHRRGDWRKTWKPYTKYEYEIYDAIKKEAFARLFRYFSEE